MIVVWILLLVLLTGGIILLLHRRDLASRRETADLSAPLGTLDLPFDDSATVSAPAPEPAAPASKAPAPAPSQGNWLERIKQLREEQALDAALALCEQQFPRVQAFQQAALILRQQLREHIEASRPARDTLLQLYRVAVMADLFRSSNPRKPHKPGSALQSLLDLDFDYQNIGYRHLRLLTKQDIRHLEQLWGRPRTHQHAEQALESSWLALCE